MLKSKRVFTVECDNPDCDNTESISVALPSEENNVEPVPMFENLGWEFEDNEWHCPECSVKLYKVFRIVRTEEEIGVEARNKEEAIKKVNEDGGYLVREYFHSIDESCHEHGIKEVKELK